MTLPLQLLTECGNLDLRSPIWSIGRSQQIPEVWMASPSLSLTLPIPQQQLINIVIAIFPQQSRVSVHLQLTIFIARHIYFRTLTIIIKLTPADRKDQIVSQSINYCPLIFSNQSTPPPLTLRTLGDLVSDLLLAIHM